MGDPSGKNPSSDSTLAIGREKELTPDEADAFARQFKAVWEKSSRAGGPVAKVDAPAVGAPAPQATQPAKRPESYPAGPLSPRPQDITPRGIGPVSILPGALSTPAAPAAPAPVSVPAPPPLADFASEKVALVPKVSTRPAPKHTLLGIAPVMLPRTTPSTGDSAATAESIASAAALRAPDSGSPAAPAALADSFRPPPVQVQVQVLQEKPAAASPTSKLPSVMVEPTVGRSVPTLNLAVPAAPPVRPPATAAPAATAFDADDMPNMRPRSGRTIIVIALGALALVAAAALLFGGKSDDAQQGSSATAPNRSEAVTAVAIPESDREKASVEKEAPQATPPAAATPPDSNPEPAEAPAAPLSTGRAAPGPGRKANTKPQKQASTAPARPAQAAAKRPVEPKSPPVKTPASPPKSPAIVRDNPF